MRINAIEKFMLDDVRCFGGRHEFNIRPLTFLVGENSTGKSTVLGCLQSLLDSSIFSTDFNSEPYWMGTFSDIVRKSRPKKTEFQLGITLACEEVKGGKLQTFLKLKENKDKPEPNIDEVRWVFSDGEIIFSKNNDQHEQQDSISPFRVTIEKNKNKYHVFMDQNYFGDKVGLGRLFVYLNIHSGNKDEKVKEIAEFLDQQFFRRERDKGKSPFYQFNFYSQLEFLLDRTHSIAPIRSKPKRTYDPLKEAETPEGSEMPMVLMRLSATSKDEWAELKRNIMDFGKVSGLFTDIKVRHLGKLGDPFQLQITVRGPRSNLMDVGYGVS